MTDYLRLSSDSDPIIIIILDDMVKTGSGSKRNSGGSPPKDTPHKAGSPHRKHKKSAKTGGWQNGTLSYQVMSPPTAVSCLFL